MKLSSRSILRYAANSQWRRAVAIARYDKYDPTNGGFRAQLAVDTEAGEGYTPVGVGLDVYGHVVAGAGQTGVVGVYIPHGLKKVGDIVDVMTSGEIVELAGGTPGTVMTADATTGVVDDTAVGAGTNIALGFTVEATRLVVRVGGLA